MNTYKKHTTNYMFLLCLDKKFTALRNIADSALFTALSTDKT